ncbi:MAG TPA: hypothetical protein VFP20_11350 [Bacteroidales bacterium]|nr:hypothetical protein [Bacteroidales bacterium]
MSSIMVALLISAHLSGQSPHGNALRVSCHVCHTTENWKVKEKGFDHHTTSFKLDGQHKDVSCKTCHPSLVFTDAQTDCASCHKDVHQETVGRDCDRCHNTTSWMVGKIREIHRLTRFPLEGGHAGVDCNQCHKSGSRLRFDPISTECESCHLKDYNATTNPAHAVAQFPTDCKMCHDETDWKNASFDHNSTTSFPLRGGHLGLNCNQCHSQGFAGTATACVACHQKDFNTTINPSHSAAGFSADCQTCHTETSWKPSSYNHNTATSFPLNGGHRAVSCNQCHTQGFVGTSTACVACHLKDYNATTNPAHATAKFPTNCETCHTTTTWTTSTFNHDSQNFPIYSGRHRGLWTTCTQCHTSPANFAVFSCITCHEHNKTSMDAKHLGRSGYVYNSINCLSCHPRGST